MKKHPEKKPIRLSELTKGIKVKRIKGTCTQEDCACDCPWGFEVTSWDRKKLKKVKKVLDQLKKDLS